MGPYHTQRLSHGEACVNDVAHRLPVDESADAGLADLWAGDVVARDYIKTMGIYQRKFQGPKKEVYRTL